MPSSGIEILYEDNHLIGAYKPHRMPGKKKQQRHGHWKPRRPTGGGLPPTLDSMNRLLKGSGINLCIRQIAIHDVAYAQKPPGALPGHMRSCMFPVLPALHQQCIFERGGIAKAAIVTHTRAVRMAVIRDNMQGQPHLFC